MRRLAALVLVLAIVAIAGCGSKSADDPFTADMNMICAAGQGRDDLPPEMRRIEAMKEIAAKVKTADAARFMAGFGELAPADRPAYLKGALDRARLTRCAALEQW